jgi:hypothetical protein
MPDEIELTEEEDRALNAVCDEMGKPLIEQMKRRHAARIAAESESEDELKTPDDVEEAKRP